MHARLTFLRFAAFFFPAVEAEGESSVLGSRFTGPGELDEGLAGEEEEEEE